MFLLFLMFGCTAVQGFSLCAVATTGVNVPDFAKVVRDWWERRQMQAVLESGLESIRCAPVEVLPAEIRNETIEQLDAISSNQIPQTTRALKIGEAAREAMTNLSDAIQRNGHRHVGAVCRGNLLCRGLIL